MILSTIDMKATPAKQMDAPVRPEKSTGGEEGQTLILLAVVMSAILMMAALVIDGGFGLVQMRRAQNAADFASMAASKLMPCSVGAGASVTATQIQQTIQSVVDANEASSTTTSWTGQYLDKSGQPIAGATLSSSSAIMPPSTACGVAVKVKGTWNSFLAKVAGFAKLSAVQGAGSIGTPTQGLDLAIASLLPYGRHTIYAGAVGQFTVNGSMFDNSVAQCNDRLNSCKNYPPCLSGTPVSNIVCYGDSADVFQDSTETITGTLYSVAPVALEPCFYPAPVSGTVKALSATQYPQYYGPYGCGTQFSQADRPQSYGSLQGNADSIADPLAYLPDPSANNNAGAVCPGQSGASTSSVGVVSGGTLSPAVYTNTVVINGPVTLLPCETNGRMTGPGVYVFQHGVEICPTGGSTVTGNNVTLFNEGAPSSTFSNSQPNAGGYCAAASSATGGITSGIDLGGTAGASINLTAPSSGPYQGVSLYQSRNINLNIGLDDGWLHSSAGAYVPDGANITVNGVVYDNSFHSVPTNLVFSYIGQSYRGPYSALCTGITSARLDGDPVPCPGVSGGGLSAGLDDSSGVVSINGAVIVGAFGTQGGSSTNPLTLTISYSAAHVPGNVSNVRLVF